jgi:hypothetical protein
MARKFRARRAIGGRFNGGAITSEAVTDPVGGVQDFAVGKVVEFGHDAAGFWKVGELPGAGDKRIAKSACPIRAVLGDVAHDCRQIVNRTRRKNYFPAQL